MYFGCIFEIGLKWGMGKFVLIFMTKKGNVVASQIVSKHRLTESFLVNVMGFKTKEVHEIAEEIEHINSPKFFNRMKKIVKNAKTDPHGSKIPNCKF